MKDIESIRKNSAELARLLKVLSHPKRLMLLCFLTEGEKNVSDIIKYTQLSQSQTSQYLADLEAKNFLSVRQAGKNRFYKIKEPKIEGLIESFHIIFCQD
jgi:DNA-binding transcriptional ArsR family regulator